MTMDCLELNVHQHILSDLAAFKHDTKGALTSTQDLLQSKAAPTSASATQDTSGNSSVAGDVSPRVYMSEARAHYHIAFGELVLNFPEEHLRDHKDSLIDALLAVLRDAADADFDPCLSWDEWALPDQLVYSTVSALFRICFVNEDCGYLVVDAIVHFVEEVVEKLKGSSSIHVLTQLAPSVHGLYRAITSTIYPWAMSQWVLLSRSLGGLVDDRVLERIDRLLLEIHPENDANTDSDAVVFSFCRTFISRYTAAGRPLSGYFIVCCVMEVQWTALAQSLVPISLDGIKYGGLKEAAAANKAWLSLVKRPAQRSAVDTETVEVLTSTAKGALQCFNDLLAQMEDMEMEPPVDTYAWETMSECLKLASICCLATGNLDPDLYARLGLLLSDRSPIIDDLVQEAALKSTTLRRNALRYALKAIKLAPGDDSIMSNMYSLLNFIAATSKEISESSSQQLLNNPLYGSSFPSTDQLTYWGEEMGLRGRTDEEKHLIGTTTISIATRLALEFDEEEVTKLTISMLLQRLRTAEPRVEAAIAYNLVDLALVAPGDAFVDIIRAFSSVSRTANSDDPRFSNNMILAAQTRLARELDRRPDLYDIYLDELLTLFSDKGIEIQNAASSGHHGKVGTHFRSASILIDELFQTEEMIDQLVSLLLPIEALLNHPDFSPHVSASPELTSLFRNMWFLCILFNFTSAEDKEREKSAMAWLVPALGSIAMKTPSLVLEGATDALSKLDYNANIRHEYTHLVMPKHRACLTRYIPLRASDIRSLSTGQVIFLLAMHDIENLRSGAGMPTSLVSYFTNSSLNKHVALSACMDAIAEKAGCIVDLNIQASEQALPAHLSCELRSLLVSSTHRITRARELASKYLNRLIKSFPSLMCDSTLVYAILECLTLLRRACDNEFVDEVSEFSSVDMQQLFMQIILTDNYNIRNVILTNLQENANIWFELALSRAPIELQSTLQKYLATTQSLTGADTAELGASVAERFAKGFGPMHHQLTSLYSLSRWKPDRARVLASQLASKGYFAGESAGLRLAYDQDKSPPNAHSGVIEALQKKMAETLDAIRNKNSNLVAQDLKRLLFRCAATLISMEKCEYNLLRQFVAIPFEVFTPPAIAAGIEVWTWVIAEKPTIEVALMSEVLAAWFGTVRERKGVFSQSLNYEDPFYHPISYSPTDREEIDRATSNARRLLVPHKLVLQMLFSRLQAARYCRSAVMFLIQRLVLRSAYAHKLFSRLKNINHPLRLLVENEIYRLTVWANPNNDLKKEMGHHCVVERSMLEHILVWVQVPPVIAVTFFEKKYNADPHLLQYAHRVLEQHPVDLTFFFVPQIVQALRFDELETAKISQLFCHQIIWNMKANCYKDDAAEVEDPLKPALDRMAEIVIGSLSGDARSFYDREFNFFHEVTSISGKLKPFIKKTKLEKKAKIDEEMAKICVDVGVYLPSNPDGRVVDIDKHSGRPLQSHAKAPFMATFKVRKTRVMVDADPEALLDGAGVEKHEDYDVWQQAIFKVGDDCRQDVLALQVIAMFKNVFTSIGLTLYLYPYRVTATGPGCGVIDVIPNSTSRDEMGRAKVNDLLGFFISKYGGEETIAFQRARSNFIQSMAAYSLACYILQIKDRHNGNIMIDGEGHIIHIGFLALRPHADQLVSTVQLMLGTELPSFKGEATIKRLKDRFALALTEHQAAEWMIGVIRNAHENFRSTAYDEFQRLQNGIPYK
ncbi:hypothetical protein ID866_2765 [Astraeus odoratus]|nr:hypothetical protein ID866_2765 [Astraeus odoratus]